MLLRYREKSFSLLDPRAVFYLPKEEYAERGANFFPLLLDAPSKNEEIWENASFSLTSLSKYVVEKGKGAFTLKRLEQEEASTGKKLS